MIFNNFFGKATETKSAPFDYQRWEREIELVFASRTTGALVDG